MTNHELAAKVRRILVETGSLVCLGCGFEHSCGVHGCRLLRMAADALENSETHVAALQKEIEGLRGQLERRWIPVTERMPESTYDASRAHMGAGYGTAGGGGYGAAGGGGYGLPLSCEECPVHCPRGVQYLTKECHARSTAYFEGKFEAARWALKEAKEDG